MPLVQAPQVAPPQSTSVSARFFVPSVQLAVPQTPATQELVAQSEEVTQAWPEARQKLPSSIRSSQSSSAPLQISFCSASTRPVKVKLVPSLLKTQVFSEKSAGVVEPAGPMLP